MTLNFSDFTRRLRAGEAATEADIYNVLGASPAATFALIEYAAELRGIYFGTGVTVLNLPGAPGLPTAAVRLEVPVPLDAEELTVSLLDTADRPGALALDFVTGEGALVPMEALRVIAAARITAPAASLHLGPSREGALRSLQPLAVGAVDSLELIVDPARPQLIFEDLRLIKGSGLTVAGAGERDLVAEYAELLRDLGVEDVETYARMALAGAKAGGCGGNCACGSGGCGS